MTALPAWPGALLPRPQQLEFEDDPGVVPLGGEHVAPLAGPPDSDSRRRRGGGGARLGLGPCSTVARRGGRRRRGSGLVLHCGSCLLDDGLSHHPPNNTFPLFLSRHLGSCVTVLLKVLS